MKRYIVKPQGRRYGVYCGQQLIEGGYFERTAAQDTADDYNTAAREEAHRADDEAQAQNQALRDENL